MSYKETQAEILTTFAELGYETLVEDEFVPVYECKSGTKIELKIPGYKWKLGEPWDFRVDANFYVKSSPNPVLMKPSHAAIMLDMYNKVKHCGMDGDVLRSILSDLAVDGSIHIDEWVKALPYTKGCRPLNSDIDIIVQYYNNKKEKWDKFTPEYNHIDWPLEELFVMIKYIAIQEDVNYPMSKGNDGRKMPYARYIEAIDVAQKELISGYEYHTLDPIIGQVITRALASSKPTPFPHIDYGAIPNITE